MTEIIEIARRDRARAIGVLFCDLWGCLHDGVRAFPAAVAALERFRARGGRVVLLTNSPRPAGDVARAARRASARRGRAGTSSSPRATPRRRRWSPGQFGRRVYHIGPERDLGFFADAEGRPFDIERVPLEEAEGIVCTGLFDDRTETPDDYRATILYGKTKGLKLLCANPDIVVDVGDRRIYCAGAIAAAYTEAGGRSYYFGKPHPPIYALARRKLAALTGYRAGGGRDPLPRRRDRHRHPRGDGRGARLALRHRRPRRGGDRHHEGPAPTRRGSPPTSPRRGWRRGWRWLPALTATAPAAADPAPCS